MALLGLLPEFESERPQPSFLRANYIMTVAWAAAFAVVAAADGVEAFFQDQRLTGSAAAGLVALAAALTFTLRYPGYVRSHGGRPG